MKNAIAFSNNDVITIAWSFGKKPVGCMGFAICRIDDEGNEFILPNKAVYPDTKEEDAKDKSSNKFPLQRFYWKDVYARWNTEKTGKRIYHYRIVPMQGVPGNMIPMPDFEALLTNKVEISPNVGDNMQAYFNRGIISTQKVARYLKAREKEDPEKDKIPKGRLLELIADYQVDHDLRESLSGDMVEALMEFLKRADNTGRIYAGLYELGDSELIEKLKSLGTKLSIILSNSVEKKDDKTKPPKSFDKKGKPKYHQKTIDANLKVRNELKDGGAETYARDMPSSHIGHNKFLVYVDADGTPKAVLLGSTNWTPNGLCAQTNNTMVIDDELLAKRYIAYWKEMAADTVAAGGLKKKLQGEAFRTWNNKSETINIGNSRVTSWFSPNTPKARLSGNKNEVRPSDMEEVVQCISNAKHAVLFLAFYPGTPSLANWTAEAFRNNPQLFVRGMVTNESAAEGFYYGAMGEVPPKRNKEIPVKQDYRVGAADAFDKKRLPPGWIEEILKAGFAIIHDKIMVIDPFTDGCVTITGSHNLGHKASYDNDENLVIIKGNKRLAQAYATHILDVYEHFAYRIAYKKNNLSDAFLKTDSEEFLSRFFDSDGNTNDEQLNFWMKASVNNI